MRAGPPPPSASAGSRGRSRRWVLTRQERRRLAHASLHTQTPRIKASAPHPPSRAHLDIRVRQKVVENGHSFAHRLQVGGCCCGAVGPLGRQGAAHVRRCRGGCALDAGREEVQVGQDLHGMTKEKVLTACHLMHVQDMQCRRLPCPSNPSRQGHMHNTHTHTRQSLFGLLTASRPPACSSDDACSWLSFSRAWRLCSACGSKCKCVLSGRKVLLIDTHWAARFPASSPSCPTLTPLATRCVQYTETIVSGRYSRGRTPS